MEEKNQNWSNMESAVYTSHYYKVKLNLRESTKNGIWNRIWNRIELKWNLKPNWTNVESARTELTWNLPESRYNGVNCAWIELKFHQSELRLIWTYLNWATTESIRIEEQWYWKSARTELKYYLPKGKNWDKMLDKW